MPAADFGELEPEVGSVLVEREVGAGPMVVGEVAGRNASQMALAENDDMIEACSPSADRGVLREAS